MSGGKPSTAHPSCRGSQAATHDVVEALRRVFARHAPKIKAAFIFGSVARGTDTARSDIDLMIIGELDYDEVYAVTDKAGVQLGRQVSPVLISPEDWQREVAVPRSFIGQLRKSPRIFVFGSEGEL